jgi:hypothetical protein
VQTGEADAKDVSCGSFDSRRGRPLEGVVDVLDLLAGQRVDVERARSAADELEDAVAREPTRISEREDAADLRRGGRAGVSAQTEPHEGLVIELDGLRSNSLIQEQL